MNRFVATFAFALQCLMVGPSASQTSMEPVCDTVFKRPAYQTRQFFCSSGELVEDQYDLGTFYPCEQMEVDHLVSLSYAFRNGICDQDALKKLANDQGNLRLTHWNTNRSKGVLSPEEFAVKKLTPEAAENVIRDAEKVRKAFGLPTPEITADTRSRWLLEERDSLRRQNAQLVDAAGAVRNKQVLYRGKKMRAAEAVSHHASRVSRRIAFSSFRNLGSMAAESLPVVGVAAIVGVTALELRDACEALKDTQELNLAFNPSSAPSEEAQTVCALEVPSRAELLVSIQNSPGKAWDTAREYTPTLPNLSDLEIGWSDYFGAVKAGTDWIVDETGASTASLLKTVTQTFGQVKLPWD